MIAADEFSEGMVRLEASSLRVAYDSFVAISCDALDLSGRILAVIGHNGAGKSTLIKAILKLLPPIAGTLGVSSPGKDNRPMALAPEKHMAFCPESGAVFADISVESYIRMWCRFKHGDANHYKTRGAGYVELLKLGPLMKRRGVELSKGQRRRVQTAIGFLCEPRLFLLDEPFDGLDVLKTHELAEIIEQHSHKTAFVLSSHRMDVVERLADSFIVLKKGDVFSFGSLEKVCRDMCGQSYRIEGLTDSGAAAGKLKAKDPTLLVSHLGEQVVITGRDINPESFREFFSEIGSPQAKYVPLKTSLVDAMNYHLREAERE